MKKPLYKGKKFKTDGTDGTEEEILFYSIDELETFVLEDIWKSKYSNEEILDYIYRMLREQGFVYVRKHIVTKVESEEEV